ncbi:MAG: hypothetical protein M3014_12160 [Chloroflexota bacterium]|nr:hypothetical protein [Chloroflexota bacterium]
MYAPILLAACGIMLIGLGAYFVLLRPPLLPEDTRAIEATGGQITTLAPGLSAWLKHVFWVMGGYMASTGVLTIYVGLVSVPGHARGASGVAALAGLLSIGWMAAVNFIIDSDFKWLLLGFALLWGVAAWRCWYETRPSQGRYAQMNRNKKYEQSARRDTEAAQC